MHVHVYSLPMDFLPKVDLVDNRFRRKTEKIPQEIHSVEFQRNQFSTNKVSVIIIPYIYSLFFQYFWQPTRFGDGSSSIRFDQRRKTGL